MQRHGDRCRLNHGNTPGEYCIVRSTDVHEAPDGADEEDKSWWDRAGDSLKEGASDFWAGVTSTSETAAAGESIWDKTGEYWNDPSAALDDAADLYDSLPTGAEIWEGTQNVAAGAAHIAGEVWDDPGGSAEATAGWVKDQAAGAWEGIEKGYAERGVMGGIGATAGVGVEFFDPFKKLRMAERALDAAEAAGDLVKAERLREVVRRRRREVEEADEAERAKKAERAEEDGGGGARSTRLHKVKCFDMPPGMDPKEYDRQLAEQMKTINNMTADDMAYAHWVLDSAGGTKALRVPSGEAETYESAGGASSFGCVPTGGVGDA